MKRRTKFVRLFCLLSLGVIAGGAVFGNIDGVRALDYQSNVGVGFTFEPTLNVTLSSADLTISNLTPGTDAEDSNIITVGVSTNAAYGYNLLATAGNVTNATTNLVNGSNSFTALSSNVGSLNGFSDNTWGYSYCIANCNTATNWVSGSQGSTSMGYAGLPLYTGTGVQLTGANDKTSSSAQFKIAAKAGATQPSGEYTNVVNFTAVTNVGVVTLLDAFVASNATQQNGYYTMQGMTPGICSIASEGSSIQLTDTRDGKMYWVTKLADGHCWMTQNLDFDLSHETTLTSLDTDLNDGSKTGAYESDYSYDANTGVISWTPANTTRNYQSSTGTPWVNDFNVAYSLDPGEWYWDGDDSTANCNGYFTVAACKDHFTGFTSSDPASARDNVNKHLSVGNYYNWSAAIASDGSGSLTTSTYNNINLNPQNSICPKGWRLPTISNMSYGTVNSTSEFGRLNQLYNGGGSTDPKLISAPLWFVRSGGIGNGSFINSGSDAYYWSSTVGDSNYAYFLVFTATGVNPADSYNRYGGRSVRCVAR